MRYPRANRYSSAARGLIAGALLAGLLAACTQGDGDRTASGIYRFANSQRNPAMETLERTAEYGVVGASRAMVHAPQALLVLERNLGGAVEQRIVLPNGTAASGDNILHLRAQTGASARAQEFSFDEVATRFGGLPAPFQRLQPGGLQSGRDGLGNYVYAREQLGTDTVCVLVMRRISPQARPLPRGTSALDMVLRNCVVGTLEQALAPMAERSLAVAGSAQPGSYTISPFAAPQR